MFFCARAPRKTRRAELTRTAAAPEVTVAASAKELGADEEDHDRDHDDHSGKAGEDHGGGSSMRFPRRMKRCIGALREARIALKRLLTSYKPPVKKEEKELTGVEGALAEAKGRVDEKRAVEAHSVLKLTMVCKYKSLRLKRFVFKHLCIEKDR